MKNILIALIFSLASLIGIAQEGRADSANLDRPPYELIYLQLDQSYYISGETIWLKAYLYSPFLNNFYSTTLYVELLNEERQRVAFAKFPIYGNSASGNITIPDNLEEGAYLLRAYTIWSLNYGDNNIFKKGIMIFHPLSKTTSKEKKQEPYVCRIYPEGGAIVNQVENYISFTVSGKMLKKERLRGAVVDKEGKELTRVFTDTLGNGQFRFTPRIAEEYRLKIYMSDNQPVYFPFPASKDLGVGFHIEDAGREKTFLVSRFDKNDTELDSLQMLGIMFDRVVMHMDISMTGEKQVSGRFKTELLPTGRLQLLLVDNKKRLLATRNTFISDRRNFLDMQISPDTISFTPRSLNAYTLSFSDSLFGEFSLSVTAADDEPATDEKENIINRFLYQVPFPVGKSGDTTNASKELVMLTGNWPLDTLAKKIVYREMPYIRIKGSIDMSTEKLKTIPEEITFIVETKDSTKTIFTAPLLPGGKFEIANLIFEDSADFYYQFMAKKPVSKQIPIKFEKDSADFIILPVSDKDSIYYKIARQSMQEMGASEVFRKKIRQGYDIKSIEEARGILLKEVVLKKPNKISPLEKVNKQYTSGPFSGTATSRSLDLVNNPDPSGAMNVFEYIKGKIPGLYVHKGPDGVYSIESPRSISTLDVLNGGNGLVNGVIFVNEIEVSSTIAENIPMDQIALVKFFRPNSLPSLPGVGISCVLAIYTKTGEPVINSKSNLGKFRYPGYSVTRDFIAPDYSIENKNANDPRRTIYWNPSLQLEGEKEIRIRFFNANSTSGYKIVLEGLSRDGRVIHFEKVFLPR